VGILVETLAEKYLASYPGLSTRLKNTLKGDPHSLFLGASGN